MTGNEFQQHVLRTANTGLTPEKALTNACMGLRGESGEFVDMIKKHIFHEHAIDPIKAGKELGDIAFYVAWAAHSLGFTLDEILQMKVDKLLKRYPNGFNSKDSIERKES